jgi:glycosyltransferase involved in cell wall biosynthesis
VLVSVVLVVYNQLPLTRACLESLRSTTLPFELCVVDNASSDGTESYFRRFPLPYSLRYQRNGENVGLIRALNAAASAGGEFLASAQRHRDARAGHWPASTRR